MTFTIPYPPSANRYWRTRVVKQFVVTYVSGEATKFKKAVSAQLVGTVPMKGELTITLKFFRPRKVGDLDNRIKCCLDALNKLCYDDDSQITAIHAYRYDDKKNPRVEVEII